MHRSILLAASLALAPLPAMPADLVFSIGAADFSANGSDDTGFLTAEHYSDPIWRFLGADWSLGVAAMADFEGDLYVAVGPAAMWSLQNDWFVEASIMPGYYHSNDDNQSLGNDFEIRNLIGVGRKVSDRLAVSVAISHTSNADVGDSNPGMNALSLRARWTR